MNLNEIVKKLPLEPGVYIYKDANGTVIYVGKAKLLKNRVRSYFHSSSLNEKTRQLVSNIADINYIVTANELEALLLEKNLIEKHQPKYNILLKDDKGYPYLRINTKEDYPKLELARKLLFDGAQYFGPYFGAGSARAIAEIALEVFPLRTCNHNISPDKTIRPCLKHQIGACSAPCINHDKEKYSKNVQSIISFLKGDQDTALNVIRKKMELASEKLEFERAAELRDKLFKATEILNKQRIVLEKNQNIDVISLYLQDDCAVICSLYVRSGRLIGMNCTELQDTSYTNAPDLMSEYILQHYSSGEMIPSEIVTDTTPEDIEILQELLSTENKKSVRIHIAQRGKKFDLCLMAKKNAREKFEKSVLLQDHKTQRTEKGLEELKDFFRLKNLPCRIECFDISHIQGTDTVASMVVFTNGKSDKKEYRRFKTHQGNNDFASMEEIVSRRFNDLLQKKKGFDKKPDLVVIDGGKGQLNIASAVFKSYGLEEIPIISIAEKLEEIYIPQNSAPIIFDRTSPALQILQALRDEAHRFAITFHRSLHTKSSLSSQLDNIASIGKTRKMQLLRTFSTVQRIKTASIEELKAVKGMNSASAEAVYNYFNK